MSLTGAGSRISNQEYLALSSALFFGKIPNKTKLDFCKPFFPDGGNLFFMIGDKIAGSEKDISIFRKKIARLVNHDRAGIFRKRINVDGLLNGSFVTSALIGETIDDEPVIAGIFYNEGYQSNRNQENVFYELILNLRQQFQAMSESSPFRRFVKNKADFRYLVDMDNSKLLTVLYDNVYPNEITCQAVDDYLRLNLIPGMIDGKFGELSNNDLDKRLKNIDILKCTVQDTNLALLAINMNKSDDYRNQDFDLLIKNFSHKIRGKLGAIKAAIGQLSLQKGSPIDDDDITLAQIIELSADSVCQYVERLEQYSTISEKEKEKLNFNCLIEEVARSSSRAESPRELNLVLSSQTSEVNGNSNYLKMAIEEIVKNAIECGDPDGMLSIETINSDDKIILRVKNKISQRFNNIDGAKEPDFCEPFFSLQSDKTGMGLSIARKVIKEHGGRILTERADNREFQVEVELPVWQGEENLIDS